LKFLLSIALSLGVFAQTPVVTQPVSIGQTVYGLQFAAAYYAAQPPIKATLYNGRPGSVNPTSLQLNQTDFNALIKLILSTPGVLLDEQIDYWGWDPLTTMQQRVLQGIAWVPAGLGPAQCVSILQSGCVITPGMYAGTPPAGSIPTCTLLSCFPAFPVPPPLVIPTTVGPQINGPYYEVIGPVPAQGTKNGSCVLTQIPSFFMFGPSFMKVWNCQGGN
jgi:hypothetical protein